MEAIDSLWRSLKGKAKRRKRRRRRRGLLWGWSPLSGRAWSWHEAAWSEASFPDALAIREPGGRSPTSPTCQPETFRTPVQQNKVYLLRNYTENTSYLPDLTAVLMSLSALLKPSAEPVTSVEAQIFNNNIPTKPHTNASKLLAYSFPYQ